MGANCQIKDIEMRNISQNNVIIIFISIRYNLTKINNDLPDQRLLFIVKMQEITYKIRPVNSLRGEKRIK